MTLPPAFSTFSPIDVGEFAERDSAGEELFRLGLNDDLLFVAAGGVDLG